MMRREILGSLAAIFCGIALPRERETVWVYRHSGSVVLPSIEALDEVLKSMYWDLRAHTLMPTQFARGLQYQEPPR